jgi:roadblock/LC7 domain-containing protein
MGSGYYKNVTQWSQGEYNGANNKQDDLATISSSRNGAGYRSDDFGNSAATAKLLSGTSLNQFGIIETRGDTDWFRFSTATGNVSLSINNAAQAWINDGFGNFSSSLLAGRSPNLDIAATLYGADGTLIASSNPLDNLTASFNLNLNAGTYFLKVDGVGFGNPLSNGYSDYGSLGQYLLTGSLAATTATSAASELPANQVMGDANANSLAATNDKDILTGGAAADTFSFASLSSSNLANYDHITDFAIGTDKLNAPTAVSARNLKELGAVSTFDLTGISARLTATSFAANRAATFSFADTAGTRTFLAMNDATAGFSATNDAIVEITGFTGSLANLALV